MTIAESPREGRLRAVINALSRSIHRGEPPPILSATFEQPQTSRERLYQATIIDVVGHGRQSGFSGANDAEITPETQD